MSAEKIDPTAILGPNVVLGEGTVIGPYAVIEDGAVLGNHCHIQSHAVIKKHAVLGNGVEVGHFSVIGGDPQHLSFDRSLTSFAEVGSRTRIGEGVTIHRSIESKGRTVVGEDCFLMGYSHVAHDCILENQVVLANGVLLGGHVTIGSETFIGGGAAVHQFVRIGNGAMIGGLAEISLDIPPQVLVSGRNAISGLNLIGLKRRKVPANEISELKKVYRRVFEQTNVKKVAKEIMAGKDAPESSVGLQFLNFFETGTRGFAKATKHS
jgi:UDP-N-acetylglucosamine acyltransferase